MAPAKANGEPLLTATLCMPITGLWTADVVIDGDDQAKLTGSVVLDFDGLEFRGFAKYATTYQGRTEARVVGGAGGLGKDLTPKFYRDVPLSLPLNDILKDTGETLSATADTAITGAQLGFWTRLRGKGGEALPALADDAGANWRMLADGTLWLGVDTYPEQALEHDRIDEQQTHAIAHIASERPELRPGVTFLGRRISYVVHRMTGTQLRTEAYFEEAGLARMQGALDAIVRRYLVATLYLGLYPAKVVSQDPLTGLVDLLPEDQRVPSVSGVPVRHGIPGVKIAHVANGASVLLGFAGGQPDRPFATLWDAPAEPFKIGTLLVVQSSGLVIAQPEFFPAGDIGDALAIAAQSVAVSAGSAAYLVSIKSSDISGKASDVPT